MLNIVDSHVEFYIIAHFMFIILIDTTKIQILSKSVAVNKNAGTYIINVR